MNIVILGAAGFIGTNLTIRLRQMKEDNLTLVDICKSKYIEGIGEQNGNIKFVQQSFDLQCDYLELTRGCDVLYHLVSTTVPTTSNNLIAQELNDNVIVTAKLLDACVVNKVRKVVFLSSGGTVYGQCNKMPISETTETNPITSYGVQKVVIEKLLYLYNHVYGLDYRVIRLANPYGPYQNPLGLQGVVTTFVYKILHNQEITVFGDGSVIRDYIFIDDAITGILNIVNDQEQYKLFNLGSGKGTSIAEIIKIMQEIFNEKLKVFYAPARNVDVQENVLDIERYQSLFKSEKRISLINGIKCTKFFWENGKEDIKFETKK